HTHADADRRVRPEVIFETRHHGGRQFHAARTLIARFSHARFIAFHATRLLEVPHDTSRAAQTVSAAGATIDEATAVLSHRDTDAHGCGHRIAARGRGPVHAADLRYGGEREHRRPLRGRLLHLRRERWPDGGDHSRPRGRHLVAGRVALARQLG